MGIVAPSCRSVCISWVRCPFFGGAPVEVALLADSILCFHTCSVFFTGELEESLGFGELGESLSLCVLVGKGPFAGELGIALVLGAPVGEDALGSSLVLGEADGDDALDSSCAG